jgi:2',3'-cyclic-nucleotide 2'-phosphodiesterase (5'-nucleotidase family)
MKKQKLEKTKEDIKNSKVDKQKAELNNKKQRALQQQIANMPYPIKFVEQKNKALELQNWVKNWERKIEIAEVAFKKARIILKNGGEIVDNVERPNITLEYN